jgi:hypothetical protein
MFQDTGGSMTGGLMTSGAGVIERPNMYSLTGRGVTVSLTLTGITGEPVLTYQDSHQALSFTGEDIRIEDGELGQLASVTLVKSIDAGFTTFSVLLPEMNLIGGNHHVATVGITATHRTSLAGVGHGQLTSYHVVRLQGTASQIEPLTT